MTTTATPHFHLARYTPGHPPTVLPDHHASLWSALSHLADALFAVTTSLTDRVSSIDHPPYPGTQEHAAVHREKDRVSRMAAHINGVVLLHDNGTEILDVTLDGSTWTVDHLTREGLAVSVATHPDSPAHPGISFDLFPCDHPDCEKGTVTA